MNKWMRAAIRDVFVDYQITVEAFRDRTVCVVAINSGVVAIRQAYIGRTYFATTDHDIASAPNFLKVPLEKINALLSEEYASIELEISDNYVTTDGLGLTVLRSPLWSM